MKISVYNDHKTSLYTDLRDYFLINLKFLSLKRFISRVNSVVILYYHNKNGAFFLSKKDISSRRLAIHWNVTEHCRKIIKLLIIYLIINYLIIII